MAGAKKLALLIDADNVPAKFFAEIMERARGLGMPMVRRAYGNPTSWGKIALRRLAQEYALTPVLVIPPTGAKNAADIRLAIDAVDLLHEGWLDGFCIGSSDSDFAALANRLAEGGATVHGFGEAKTPDVFRRACTDFAVLGERTKERPRRAAPAVRNASKPDSASTAKAASTPKTNGLRDLPVAEILAAVDATTHDGKARLSDVRRDLDKRIENFDHRHYSPGKFSRLIEKIKELEMDGSRKLVWRRRS